MGWDWIEWQFPKSQLKPAPPKPVSTHAMGNAANSVIMGFTVSGRVSSRRHGISVPECGLPRIEDIDRDASAVGVFEKDTRTLGILGGQLQMTLCGASCVLCGPTGREVPVRPRQGPLKAHGGSTSLPREVTKCAGARSRTRPPHWKTKFERPRADTGPWPRAS